MVPTSHAVRRAPLACLAAMAVLLCGAVRAAEAPPAANQRPNILFAIADDWGYPHAGAYGYAAAKTPTFDKLAKEGALFTRGFSAAPSCTASRNSIMTGQAPHRLGVGVNLWSDLPTKYPTYADLLEKAGYKTGKMRKAFGPGKLSDRPHDPAGPNYRSFAEFMKDVPAGAPFCFWFGSSDPHRGYVREFGKASGIDPAKVVVPPYLPDTPEVRADIVDYLAEVQRFDKELGEALALLDEKGLANNTIVVVTGDNGWPFPRSKANLYDSGTRQPLAVRWPAKVKPGLVIDRLTVLTDFAPTFLEAAGLPVPKDMTGRSVLPALLGTPGAAMPDAVFPERERHANCREGKLAYPMRAVRTEKYLYIRNFFPDRWPAGDPKGPGQQGDFGDIDAGPTKAQVLAGRNDPAGAKLFELACGKRPAEELYDVTADPHNLTNLAADPAHAEARKAMAARLDAWMKQTGDFRAEDPADTRTDKIEYYGGGARNR